MVRYSLVVLLALGIIMVADEAQARGRRGGCSGGSCSVAYAPVKSADAVTPSATIVADASDAPVTTQYRPRYRLTGWRLFGRR